MGGLRGWDSHGHRAGRGSLPGHAVPALAGRGHLRDGHVDRLRRGTDDVRHQAATWGKGLWHARDGPWRGARPHRLTVFCRAGLFSPGAVFLRGVTRLFVARALVPALVPGTPACLHGPGGPPKCMKPRLGYVAQTLASASVETTRLDVFRSALGPGRRE